MTFTCDQMIGFGHSEELSHDIAVEDTLGHDRLSAPSVSRAKACFHEGLKIEACIGFV